VFVLVGSIGMEHTLYTEMIVSFLPSRPCRVINDHRPSPLLSSPLFVFLDRMRLSVIIAMPPGL